MSPEDRLKASFLLFLAYVWTRVLGLPRLTRVQTDIARYLEHGPRKRFIAAFRGVGKTFLTGAYIVWRLWKEPDLKIMVVSANERFAAKVAAFVYILINAEDRITREPVPWIELKSKGRQGNQKDSTMEFDVGPSAPSKDPSVFAVGITGQMTGGRADLILSDDVEAPNNSSTEAARELLEERTGEYAAILKPGGEVIYLGTFQSMASIYRGLKEKGYAMRLWPARYPLREKLDNPIYADLAPMLKDDLAANPDLTKPTASTLGGSPTDPERFTDLVLMEKETEWKAAGFQLQFMLDTSLTDQDRYPLKTRDLIVMDVPPEVAPHKVAWGSGPDQVIRELSNVGFDGDRLHRPIWKAEQFVPFTGSMMQIDPSGRGADETAYVVTKFLNGQVYVRRWGGFKDGHSPATLRALAEIAKSERVNLVRVEGNFGDGMFARLLEPVLRSVDYSVPVEDHKVSGQKELRILSFVRPALENHRVILDATMVRQELAAVTHGGVELSGLYQLTHLNAQRGSLKHDDRIDALAMALEYWTAYMNADAEEALQKAEAAAAKEFERKLWDTRINPGATRRKGRPRGQGRRTR